MVTIGGMRERRGMSLMDLAQRLGVSEAQLRVLERNDVEGKLETDTRDRVLTAMGADPREMTPDQDRSLALHTLVARKLITAPDAVRAIATRNLQRLRAPGRSDAYWTDRWARVLELPDAEIALLLSERSQDAADMRQGAPFAGVLSDAERLTTIMFSTGEPGGERTSERARQPIDDGRSERT